MKNIKNLSLIFLIMMLMPASYSSAMSVVRVAQGESLSGKINSRTPQLYIIEGDCSLTDTVYPAAGSVFKFEGGMITGNGRISSSRMMIDAPHYQIFDDSIKVSGIANGEVSAHWWGAVGDSTTPDCGAIKNALRDAEKSWVVLDNLVYLTESTIELNFGQKLRCAGTIKYSGSDAAIDLRHQDIELDIYGIEQAGANSINDTINFKGSAVRLSGSVHNSNINVNKIKFFDKAFELTPTHYKDVEYSYAGIQYCKINWLYVVSNYGIYIDMVKGINPKYNEISECRTWVNENQFNGGRLICKYGIYSTPVDTIYNKYIGLINGNVFNSIGFEGEGSIRCKAITLHNAWHNNFNDIRLSEGYVDFKEQPWIELNQCGYLNFSFKSLIPYDAVNATKCNHIKIDGAICDSGLGSIYEFDRMYILNENSKYNPLNSSSSDASRNYKFVTRDFVPTAEFKHIYVGNTSTNTEGGYVKNLNFNDLFCANGNMTEMSDKCVLNIRDNSTLNISTSNSLSDKFLSLELICRIDGGSKVVFINEDGKTITLTETGVYYVRPLGNDFVICSVVNPNQVSRVFEDK